MLFFGTIFHGDSIFIAENWFTSNLSHQADSDLKILPQFQESFYSHQPTLFVLLLTVQVLAVWNLPGMVLSVLVVHPRNSERVYGLLLWSFLDFLFTWTHIYASFQ